MKKEKPTVVLVSALIVFLFKLAFDHFSVGHPVLSWVVPALIVLIGIAWWYKTKSDRNNSN
jgi:hypothetical protein